MRSALANQPSLADRLIEPDPGVVVAPLAAPGLTGRAADGLDLILEGFLLHHGTARLLDMPHEARVLAGDYCYAHGLVQVAEAGDLRIIHQLADLVALSASLVAMDEPARLPDLWRATVASIAGGGDIDEALERAKDALRTDGDTAPLRALAATLPPTPEMDEVFDA